MTAFGQAVIDIANDPAYDTWTFSQKIRHALEQETTARTQRRMLKLLKASNTPNPAACVEDIHYLAGPDLNRDVSHGSPPAGGSSTPQTWSSSANPVLANPIWPKPWSTLPAGATTPPATSGSMTWPTTRRLPPPDARTAGVPRGLHDCECWSSMTFSPPRSPGHRRELLNILAGRENRGATVVTSQFDPEDWYKSLHDAVVAESILNRIVSTSELIQLDGPNMRRHAHTRQEGGAAT